jgi:flagellar biosynthesis/type III secretory pathway chaperone
VTGPDVDISSAAEPLRRLLDEEIALLDLRRSQLSSLCGAIVDRDEDAVGRLLEQIERAQQLQAATDGQLQALRAVLADRLARPPEQLRLSTLIELVPVEHRDELTRRRERVIELAEQLQMAHVRAVVLVTECARVNRLLLAALLGGGDSVTTYNAVGADPWRTGPGLVDAEL